MTQLVSVKKTGLQSISIYCIGDNFIGLPLEMIWLLKCMKINLFTWCGWYFSCGRIKCVISKAQNISFGSQSSAYIPGTPHSQTRHGVSYPIKLSVHCLATWIIKHVGAEGGRWHTSMTYTFWGIFVSYVSSDTHVSFMTSLL
jgi:hypothetical protein